MLYIVQLRVLECNEKPVLYNVYFALCWDESVVDWCLLFVFLFLGRKEGELLPIIAAVLERNRYLINIKKKCCQSCDRVPRTLSCCSKFTRTFLHFLHILLATSGLGRGGGRAAAAAGVILDLVVIIGLKGGQFYAHTSATVAARARAGAAVALGGAVIVIVIEVRIEAVASGIGGITLNGGAQHGGAQSAQQFGDDAVRLLIDLLQQPVENLGPNSGVVWSIVVVVVDIGR